MLPLIFCECLTKKEKIVDALPENIPIKYSKFCHHTTVTYRVLIFRQRVTYYRMFFIRSENYRVVEEVSNFSVNPNALLKSVLSVD
jgi:hypothetical protein